MLYLDAIADVERALAQSGRILVRPSGPKPPIRVMIEGAERATIERFANRVASVIEAAALRDPSLSPE